MKSHECEFGARDLLRLLGWPLVPVAVFALVLHAGAMTRIWPSPRPTLDTDRTILAHQVEASRARQDADVVLIGDSSCLMDVSAKELGEQLGRRVLNLGTLSYLDLEAYATLLRQFTAANPGRPTTVVLLLHPEALRRAAPEKHHLDILQSILRGVDHCPSSSASGGLSCLLGLEILRGRLWSRVVPSPLGGAYGRRYGFSADLDKFMDAQHGSALDPDAQRAQGDADYRLARALEKSSRTFKLAVPTGARLLVGITPAPEKFVRANHQARCDEMLAEWSRWLRADATLAPLPVTLPDEMFARTTHLNADGVGTYTKLLAERLKSL